MHPPTLSTAHARDPAAHMLKRRTGAPARPAGAALSPSVPDGRVDCIAPDYRSHAHPANAAPCGADPPLATRPRPAGMTGAERGGRASGALHGAGGRQTVVVTRPNRESRASAATLPDPECVVTSLRSILSALVTGFRRDMLAAAIAAPLLACPPVSAAPLSVEGADPAPENQDRAPETPLTPDPALVTGTLHNGMSYLFRRHEGVPGRVALVLQIDAGSMHETDEQVGAARLIERLARAGSAHFPSGTLEQRLGARGVHFGELFDSMVGYDQSTYSLTIPDADARSIEAGLLFLSDVAGRLLLEEQSIIAQRKVQEELERARQGAQLRVNEALQPRLFPGTALAERFPAGGADIFARLTREHLQDYYRRNYVPSRARIVIVGDAEAKPTLAAVQERFGELRGPPPEIEDGAAARWPAVRLEGRRAVSACDPEIASDRVQVLITLPVQEGVRTAEQMRAELVNNLAAEALARRFADRTCSGAVPAGRAAAFTAQPTGITRWSVAWSAGQPGTWKEQLAALCAEIERARRHGFTETERRGALTSLLLKAAREHDAWSSDPPERIAARYAELLRRGSVILSPAQHLEMLSRLAPTVTGSDLHDAVRTLFDMRSAAFIVLASSASPAPPAETEILSVVHAALDAPLEPGQESSAPSTILSQEPVPGAVDRLSLHPASAVRTAWMANGACLHIRSMPSPDRRVHVTISLAGGRIEEGPATFGLTSALSILWTSPATRERSSCTLRSLLADTTVELQGRIEDDRIAIDVTATKEQLPIAMQLIHALLSGPVIEARALESWRQAAIQQARTRRVVPRGAVTEALFDALSPDEDRRLELVGESDAEAITLEAVQFWADRLAAAPLEASIVGDVPVAEALELGKRYLGSLPPRPRIAPTTHQSLRTLAPVRGPIDLCRQIPTPNDQAVVLVGFRGANACDEQDARLLELAARILRIRLERELRDRRQLVFAVEAVNRPSVVFSGAGQFWCAAICAPDRCDDLARTMDQYLAEFAAAGPDAADLDPVRAQLADETALEHRDAGYWADVLSSIVYRSRPLDNLMTAQSAVGHITPREVRDAFRRYHAPERAIRLIVTPAPAAP